jgi:transposase
MKLSPLELSASDRAKLQEVVAKGRNWQAHYRAQILLYFDDGLSAKDIAALQDLNIDTVYDRRKDWLSKGFACLFDVHRSGAPPKLNAIHLEQINIWVEEKALTAPAIVALLKEECDVEVSVGTVRNALKALGIVWKRTCLSLKKNEMKSGFDEHKQKSKG